MEQQYRIKGGAPLFAVMLGTVELKRFLHDVKVWSNSTESSEKVSLCAVMLGTVELTRFFHDVKV